MKIKQILIILLIIFTSCQSDDEVDNPMPVINTLNASVGANGGINVYGSYELNGYEISKIGFEVSTDSLFVSEKKRYEVSNNSTAKISYFVTTGIEENIRYYYRAFLQTPEETFYGETRSIVSDGSVSPEITGLSSNYGHIADTLTIYGHFFKDINYQTFVFLSEIRAFVLSANDSVIQCTIPVSIRTVSSEVQVQISNRIGRYEGFTLHKPLISTVDPLASLIGDTITIAGDHFDISNTRNRVFFNDIKATVIESRRQELKVVVPAAIDAPASIIRVNAQLQDTVFKQSFTLLPPEIDDITPLTATFRDELTITGKNFDLEISGNKVYFGNVLAQITYADRNTIKVIVPDNLEKSRETISVFAQAQQTSYNEPFQLIAPQINLVPQSAYTDEDITIAGDYFHSKFNKNTVTFEDVEATIVSGDKENLTVKVPRGPYPRRKATVKIQLLDLVVEYQLDLTVLDKWIMVSNDLPFEFYRSINGAAVANNEAYLITRSRDFTDTGYYLWKFNPDDYSWTKYVLPFQPKFSASVVSNDEKLYVYSALDNNDFWEFDPASQQWARRSQFPGVRRDYTMHFAIHGDIYIGAGVDIETYDQTNYRDVYKYSPSSDTWSKIADFPYNELFMRIETSSFVINDIAYVGNGATNTGAYDFWSYLPLNNEWKPIADFPDARLYTASFQLGNLGYVTCGTSMIGSATKDCWIYDPSLNTWSKSDDIGRLERNMHFAFSLNGKGYVGGGGTTPSGGNSGFDLYEYKP